MRKTEGKRIRAVLAALIMILLGTVSCTLRETVLDISGNEKGDQKTGLYDISLEGGSGKAYINSPVEVKEKDGTLYAVLVWSSSSYDYMIVDGQRYENENPGGSSTFTVKIKNTEEPLKVVADTLAMSRPHEIEYVISWEEKAEEEIPEEGTAFSDLPDKETVIKALEEEGYSAVEDYSLEYAKGFEVKRYDGFDLVFIENSGIYLIEDEDGKMPEKLPEGLVKINRSPKNTYLASSSAMDLINACGALADVRLSGTEKKDWYIGDARKAMEEGRLIYAGKYRAPDYELILEEGCELAIENTMIYHQPAVKEKLEELGIPVLVETSSYEDHPLGRLEWVKLYGIIFNREEEAESFFEKELKSMEPLLKDSPDTQKTAAFFYVTSNGLINVRKPGDYITKMIELAGGHYVPNEAPDAKTSLAAMNMQMEDFYEEASEADILIYNGTIGGEIGSVEELAAKNSLFKEFKAVKEGRVYCSRQDLFQQITGMSGFMRDLNRIFNDREENLIYLKRLE